MHPILFEIKGFPIYTYGPLMALGFLLSFLLLYHIASRREEDIEFYMDLYLFLIISGLLGAKILYNITEWDRFVEDPIHMMNCRSGGLVWYGGVILATAVTVFWARRKGVPVLQVCDSLAAPMGLGLAVGRIGCLMGGCCHGKICDLPWAISYPEGAMPLMEMAERQGIKIAETEHLHEILKVHPSPIYESLASLLIALLIYIAIRKGARMGVATAMWFSLYSVARYILEIYRGDHIRKFVYESDTFSVSTSQFIGFLIFGGALILWVYIFTRPSMKLVTAAELAPEEPPPKLAEGKKGKKKGKAKKKGKEAKG